MSKGTTKKAKAGPGRIILIVVLLAVIAFCAYQILPYTLGNIRAEKLYDRIRGQYAQTADQAGDRDPALWWYTDVDIDVAGLQETYPDVIGWIRFDHPEDDILIDYPILYSGDDDAYLHHDMDGSYSYPGSIFLEGQNQPSLWEDDDMSAILYGHNMRNGTMFGTLKHFREDGIYEKNRFFTVYTKDMAYRYQVFSFFVTEDGSSVYYVGFGQDDAYRAYLDDLLSRSEIETGLVPDIDQHIMVLSTCQGSGTKYRFVVCGVCTDRHAYTGSAS